MMIAMNHILVLRLTAAFVASSLCVAEARETFYSKPELANQSVGLLETEVRNGSYRGSATVVRDERLLYSCAHIVYDRGTWANDYTFHLAWHDRRFPAKRLGASPRGFHYFTRYARAARYTNGESNASFAADFTVFYGNQSFGPASPVQENSGPLLRTTRGKRIIGYPAQIDFTRARGYSYQHNTGWFPNAARRIRGGFHDFSGVSTGTGNSGGGIFLRDPYTGGDLFAGVLVSGGYRNAGVVAMDASTRRLADDALGSVRPAWSAANTNRILLGGARTHTKRILPVSEGGHTDRIVLDLELAGVSGDQPKVYLQSPAGRIRRIDIDPAHAGLRSHDVSDAFSGTVGEGTWVLRLGTGEASSVTFVRASLRGTSAE
jgi:hypothetical protein